MKKLVALVVAGISLLVIGRYSFLHVGDWLSVSEPPRKADVIICLAGNLQRIDKAVLLLGNGMSSRLFITSEDSLHYLERLQTSGTEILLPVRYATSTYEEALVARSYFAEKSVRQIMVISDAYHMFRVRWTFEHVFAAHQIQFNFVALPRNWEKRSWWEDPEGRVFVCSEVLKILYYWLGHGLFRIEEDPAWARKLETLLDHSLHA